MVQTEEDGRANTEFVRGDKLVVRDTIATIVLLEQYNTGHNTGEEIYLRRLGAAGGESQGRVQGVLCWVRETCMGYASFTSTAPAR